MGFGDDHVAPKAEAKKVTEKLLPVLIGFDYEHVMANAVIEQTAAVISPTTHQVLEPDKVVITITAQGANARELGDFVAANEIVALSFGGVPVRPVSKKGN